MNELGIKDNPLVGYTEGKYMRSFSHYEYYLLKQRLDSGVELHPLHDNDSLESHPFVIPTKGKEIQVYPWNMALLCNTLNHHEGRKAYIKNDTLHVEGKPVNSYTFQKDYYWMVANNPINLLDSRLFGLVPHDHLIGRVSTIWFSSQKERIFQSVQ
jgi:signal peptidase I